ncbi:DUF3000 domain-containing protein [Nakamurella flavida]|uniref:DUF3000 domain-containing protein n=1 Tax=Nakamurella flavida TaxID=363630 RepID=A0A939C173_9ACTN|nr:DUF3000 domain-containing protein [Nakamurella flavida]MBM9477433.1 DUF3000 domain-containing protein [Nakamurella flavida]MDP9777366.1 hypothetical protein [Nakamurella flavida]
MSVSAQPLTPVDPAGPIAFQEAVAGLQTAVLRREIEIGTLPAPGRLAPWSHAMSATIPAPDGEDEIASGRLILLHDPDGVDAWGGTLRIVVFATSEVDPEIAVDPLLPEVAWSWLVEALAETGADYSALGGTVTATSSTRFGDISGPHRVDDLELRASWTPDPRTGLHLQAFGNLLAAAAGLPPEGVTTIGRIGPPNVR